MFLSDYKHHDQKTCNFAETVADPDDCRYYYQCSGGRLYHFYCGIGAVFDPAVSSCVSPNTVENCAGVTTILDEPADASTQSSLHTSNFSFPLLYVLTSVIKIVLVSQTKGHPKMSTFSRVNRDLWQKVDSRTFS